MALSSLLRISSRMGPTAARRSRRAASTAASTHVPQRKLDSVLIANRGEIALYGYDGSFFFFLTSTDRIIGG